MAGNTGKVVIVQGSPIQQEAIANTAGILPGHLIMKNADGTVDVHGTAAQAAGVSLLLAVEQTELGLGISDAYVDATTVKYALLAPGDKANVLLKTGNSVTPASVLESAGDGTFQLRTTGQALMRANETFNNTSGSAGRLLATAI